MEWTRQRGVAEYSDENVPSVIAAGSQVLIHEDYTVSMPKAFGEYFYRRGGRVDIELNHTHHPLITVLRFWVPWNDPDRSEREYDLLAMRESIDAAGSPLRAPLAEGTDLVIREVSFDMYWFEVAAVFSDLVAGVRAAQELAHVTNVSLGLSLSEAWSASPDPLEHLRSTWAKDTRPKPTERPRSPPLPWPGQPPVADAGHRRRPACRTP